MAIDHQHTTTRVGVRILDISNRIPYPLRDGGAISIYGMLRGMHEAGMDVTFFTLNTSKHFQKPDVIADIATKVVAPYIDNHVTALGALKSLLFPMSLKKYGMAGTSSYWIERFLDADILKQLYRLVEDDGPYDIVQSESIFVAPYAIALMQHPATRDARFVLRSHNIEHQIQARLAAEPSNSSLVRWYRSVLARQTEAFERSCAAYFDAVATVTPLDEGYFRDHCPGLPTRTIQPGTPLPELTDTVVKPHSICLLASLEWAPNVEGAKWFVEQVMPRIRKVVPDAVVHIGGRNPSREALALDNGTSVIVHGEVADASEFRRSCTISVVPLFSGSGLRMKILEAFALRTAVVSTAVGAEGIELTHDVHLAIADTPQDFADACIRLLQHPEDAEQLAENALALATENFGWGRRVQQFQDLYRSLLANTRRVHKD